MQDFENALATSRWFRLLTIAACGALVIWGAAVLFFPFYLSGVAIPTVELAIVVADLALVLALPWVPKPAAWTVGAVILSHTVATSKVLDPMTPGGDIYPSNMLDMTSDMASPLFVAIVVFAILAASIGVLLMDDEEGAKE